MTDTTAPDYAALIDAETWAFIRKSESFYPPDTATRSIAEQRAIYDRMCHAFHHGLPPGVTTRDAPLGGVPCRLYQPPAEGANATVVYLHGGGFVVGGLDSHDDVCAEICAGAGARVVSVDYRLAPEHRHPAAFDDALAAARAAARQFGPVVLAGDSAGGNLAAAVTRRRCDMGAAPLAQVLIYPDLGGASDRGSYLTHAKAPMLTRDDMLFYAQIRHPEGAPAPEDDETARPLRAASLAGLPPTTAIAAECDPLADDARAYCAAITAAGGEARCTVEAGLVHGFLRARHSVPRAHASFARILGALTAACAMTAPTI